MKSKRNVKEELKWLRGKEETTKGHMLTYTTSEVYAACARTLEWVLDE